MAKQVKNPRNVSGTARDISYSSERGKAAQAAIKAAEKETEKQNGGDNEKSR